MPLPNPSCKQIETKQNSSSNSRIVFLNHSEYHLTWISGFHRWLQEDREEAYSDWLAWIQATSQLIKSLGSSSENSNELLTKCNGKSLQILERILGREDGQTLKSPSETKKRFSWK